MQAVCDEIGLKFFVSDAHHKEAGCGSGCCGLPDEGPLGNSFDGHFGEAVQIAKCNGQVRWSDIAQEAENLKAISFYRAEGYNAGSTRNRANRRYQTMYDYMRECWNNIESKLSPAKHHGGAMVPTGADENGDVIYTYNRSWVQDGVRIESVAELIQGEPKVAVFNPNWEFKPEPVPDVGKVKPMRVFIPTKDRADTISTHKVFEGTDYTIVVHSETQKSLYMTNGSIDPERIVVSGVKADAYGLTRQREWICKNLVEPGEWFVFADDNIKRITAVAPEHYGAERHDVQYGDKERWRAIYGMDVDAERFMRIANECRSKAEEVGARMCGFALVDNYYFRGRKWSTLGYVIGKLLVLQNDGTPYDHTITMEDFRNTAEHLLRYGAVLVNRFAFPVAGHYEKGGMGTYEERIEYMKQDCIRLMEQYPGLFKIKKRKGFEPGTELALAIRSKAQLEQWRAHMRVAATGG